LLALGLEPVDQPLEWQGTVATADGALRRSIWRDGWLSPGSMSTSAARRCSPFCRLGSKSSMMPWSGSASDQEKSAHQ